MLQWTDRLVVYDEIGLRGERLGPAPQDAGDLIHDGGVVHALGGDDQRLLGVEHHRLELAQERHVRLEIVRIGAGRDEVHVREGVGEPRGASHVVEGARAQDLGLEVPRLEKVGSVPK